MPTNELSNFVMPASQPKLTEADLTKRELEASK